MTKIIFKIIISITILIILCVFYLSYFGINTSKFNSLIKDQIKNQNSKLDIELKKVKLHLDIRNISIKIKIQNPIIIINKLDNILLEEISSNISIRSYFENKFSVKNILIKTKNNELEDFIELYRATNEGPQNMLLKQIVKNGTIKLNANINFDHSGKISKDFKLSGNIANAELGLFNLENIKDLNLDFKISDKNYDLSKILFNFRKIKFNSDFLNIQEKNKNFFIKGNLKNKKNKIDSNLISILFKNNLDILDFSDSKFDSSSKFSFYLTKNFKVKDLFIDSNLNLNELILNYESDNIKNYISAYKNEIKLKKNKLKVKYEKNKVILNGSSEFYIQENIKNIIDFNLKKVNDLISFETFINLSNIDFKVDEISYLKRANSNVGLEIKGSTNQNKIFLKKINYIEDKNKIEIDNLKIENNKISSLDKIIFNYLTKNNFKNHLTLLRTKNNYELTGKSYDAENLIEIISSSNENKNFFNIFNNLNSKIKIEIDNTRLDEINEIYNLKGLLNVKNSKISTLDLFSKFSENEKISLSIKLDKDKKIITNFYSDRAKPFVKKYKFIKGFEDGNIIFNSTKKNNISNSRLIMDNFKVKEVPVLAKLLTLASLQGIADLLTGEGIRFTDFEMTYSNDGSLMTIDEIYAIGPAISIMMDGYMENKKLISLRGTLVPATTINRSIASIPLLGDILIGKKIGEGVFGVSFKIKGPPKDLKTTVNPIKTLTPRFITRTLEKIKKN